MAKKRFFGLILSICVTLGVMLFSGVSNNSVSVRADDYIQGEFDSIVWNNIVYPPGTDNDWCGELLSSGAPKNGYCILAFFREEGKTPEQSEIGTSYTSGRGVIDQGFNVDTYVKVNGVNIIDVADSLCYIYPVFGLFFYIPHDSITFSEQYEIPTIEIQEGLHFNNVLLPHITFEFRGELGQQSCWSYVRSEDEYNKFPFVGVAEQWNNTSADASHNQTILQFGEYEVDYLKNDKIPSFDNVVNRYSDCGKKISINGIPLWQTEDAIAHYGHGYCYLYFSVHVSALAPSNGYKIVTLHIEANTAFYDTLLPEVTLYLFKGKWVLEKPETPNDSDYENAYSFSDVFNVEQATVDEYDRELIATKESSINQFGLFMDYKLVNEKTAFNLYILGNNKQNGLRLVFRENYISLYDATQGSSLLAEMQLEPFNYDEWYSLLVYTHVTDNKITICVAIDDITYIHLDNVGLNNKTNLGNIFSVILGTGVASFKNAIYGADNKKPVLTYTGKSVYGVLPGSETIDFTIRCSAYDATDGDVTAFIEYRWPEGSLTNNKINKGNWEVEIVASDTSHNVSSLSVLVVAKEVLDVTVTFDGTHSQIYRIGDHIAPITDPIKMSDGYTHYEFIGWYYNDRLWDFENDYVIQDMNLESRFKEIVKEFCVSFVVEGLSDTSNFKMYFTYNSRLNISIFERSGYTLKAYVEDIEVSYVTVKADMEVKLVYASNNPAPTPSSSGCGGSIVATSIILSTLSLAGLVLIAIKKIGGKKHE